MLVSDLYLSNILGFSQLPKSDRVERILNMVHRAFDVGMRNRFFYDAVQLAKTEPGKVWDASGDITTWGFEELVKLRDELDAIKAQLDEKLFNDFKAKFEEAVATTYTSFEEFIANAKLGEYDFLDWFYQNLPYVTLGMPTGEYWSKQAKERIEAMLEKCPSSQALDPLTKQLLQDYAHKFIIDWQSSKTKSVG